LAESRARTRAAALQRFIAPIRQVLALVAPQAVVTAFQNGPNHAVLQFSEDSGEIDAGAIKLRGDADVGLLLSQRLRFVEVDEPGGPFRMRTEQYAYEIVEHSTGREIVAFHFGQAGELPANPAGALLAPDAHLHLGAASQVGPSMQGIHLPTGRISIEDVTLLALEIGWDAGVRPSDGWEQTIVANRAKFREFQTSYR
jgi:hypothetical protein